MKNTAKIALAYVFAFALFLSACVSVDALNSLSPDRANQLRAGTLQIATTGLAVPVLNNNPKYADALLAFADALAVIDGSKTVDAAAISAFVSAFAKKTGIDTKTAAFISVETNAAWQLYTSATGKTSVAAGDANFKIWLSAFSQGLRDGVTIHRAGLAPQ